MRRGGEPRMPMPPCMALPSSLMTMTPGTRVSASLTLCGWCSVSVGRDDRRRAREVLQVGRHQLRRVDRRRRAIVGARGGAGTVLRAVDGIGICVVGSARRRRPAAAARGKPALFFFAADFFLAAGAGVGCFWMTSTGGSWSAGGAGVGGSCARPRSEAQQGRPRRTRERRDWNALLFTPPTTEPRRTVATRNASGAVGRALSQLALPYRPEPLELSRRPHRENFKV